ncbi:MAG TPA: serine/threonine-protein kinase [Pyrinomonadaceae bacterium]|jgi:serine/threonine-protein kinase|nr:serine/threonine-protein kinase [Pyrinomonadaceae bacterium]
MLQCPTCGLRYANDLQECPEDGTPLQADSTVAVALPVDPLIGRTFDDKYRLDERLGVGGMGTVYRATHLLIDRPVAVKVLNPRFVEDEAAQARFRREARAAGRLQHTNAVAVTDFGQAEDGYVYIVMELLEGVTLREVLAREAPLDTARAVSMMLQVSAAVAAAHEAGIIHRDLKPANIFIVQRPHAPAVVKVLDFGIAKLAAEALDDDHQTLTQVGVMIGTPRYMSPEQCDGAKLTPAADVYSLGIILYEMLTSVTPFTGTSPLAVALKHSTEAPRPPRELVHSIPPALEEIILHALEKKPDDRPQDAGAFRRELYATAERLGLEHAGSYGAPSIESLRSAGTETPSGRLVIDIERLRESRAAAVKSETRDTTMLHTVADDGAPSTPAIGTPPPPAIQDQHASNVAEVSSGIIPDGSSLNESSSASSAAASVAASTSANTAADTNSYASADVAGLAAAPQPQADQGTVSRISINLDQKHDWRYWARQPTVLVVTGLAFLTLIVGVVALRSAGDKASTRNAGARAETLNSPTPAGSPTPSPSAEASQAEERETSRRREPERDARPTRRTAPRPKPKGPSAMGKVKNTLKKIFKNPF